MAQGDYSKTHKESGNSKQYLQYVEPASQPGWILFKDHTPFDTEKIFLQQPDLFELTGKDEMRIWKEQYDKAGNRHLRYIQYHDGIRVEGAGGGVFGVGLAELVVCGLVWGAL